MRWMVKIYYSYITFVVTDYHSKKHSILDFAILASLYTYLETLFYFIPVSKWLKLGEFNSE